MISAHFEGTRLVGDEIIRINFSWKHKQVRHFAMGMNLSGLNSLLCSSGRRGGWWHLPPVLSGLPPRLLMKSEEQKQPEFTPLVSGLQRGTH